MSERLVNVDRETPMLLPVDLREWVPEDGLVHFVISAVETMNLPALTVNQRGSGSRQYPPRMMLALVIYCYANGLMSSRRIERATYRDLGVRYLTADTHPDPLCQRSCRLCIAGVSLRRGEPVEVRAGRGGDRGAVLQRGLQESRSH